MAASERSSIGPRTGAAGDERHDPQSLLVQLPQNPMPPVAAAGHLSVSADQTLRYARFAASGPFRGTVVLLSGRNEPIEKYFETIADLSRMGFACLTFDWRGQGGSSRLIHDAEKGYLDSFDTLAEDLEVLFRKIVLPDCKGPVHLVAHSAGGLAALYAGPSLQTRISRMVLLAPFIGFGDLPVSGTTVARAARILVALGLGGITMWGKRRAAAGSSFVTNRLTSDASRFARNQAIIAARPQLGLTGPTVAWVNAAARAIADVSDPEHYAQIRTPILFINAGHDQVVSPHAAARLADAMRSASHLTIDGARHELLQEADLFREQALAAIDAFLHDR